MKSVKVALNFRRLWFVSLLQFTPRFNIQLTVFMQRDEPRDNFILQKILSFLSFTINRIWQANTAVNLKLAPNSC